MIKLIDITKRFGSHTVLNGINLEVPQGQCVAIIGPSGSGKSTLLRCINFLEVPSSGVVMIDGERLTEETSPRIREHLGMVFQHFNLFNNKTVLENIVYSPKTVLKLSHNEAVSNALSLLKKVGLEHKVDAYPHSLSGGQKQRIAIVRALAMNPKILLFDEPTSALDPEMVKEVLYLIQELAHSGITLLLNTHELAFARKVADRIVFLDGGQIIEDADPETFFEKTKSDRVKSFLDKVL